LGGKDVGDDGNEHPEHVFFTGSEEQQGSYEIHALAVANFRVVHTVSGENAGKFVKTVAAGARRGRTTLETARS
jgi:hypothetical protein